MTYSSNPETKSRMNSLDKSIENFLASTKRFNRSKPSIYFLPISRPFVEIGPEDPYPPEFYVATNLLNPARQVEIFNFTYLTEIRKLLLLLRKSMRGYELLASAFYLRCFLETLSFYLAQIDEIIIICEKIVVSNITDYGKLTEDEQRELLQANYELQSIRIPTTIDYHKFRISEDFTKNFEVKNRADNVHKHLKKIDREIAMLHPLYSLLSEILHPNAVPSLFAGVYAGLGEGASPRVVRFDYDEEGQTKLYFDHIFVGMILPRTIEFLNISKKLLIKKNHKLLDAQSKCLKQCKSLARSFLKNYTNLDDPRYHAGFICPCGSNKEFKKCCGRIVSYR